MHSPSMVNQVSTRSYQGFDSHGYMTGYGYGSQAPTRPYAYNMGPNYDMVPQFTPFQPPITEFKGEKSSGQSTVSSGSVSTSTSTTPPAFSNLSCTGMSGPSLWEDDCEC